MATARQRKRRHSERVAASRPRRGPCLYCRSAVGPWRSQEHIIPESVGNTEKILPRGVVCDPCNHGPLSRLDQTFADFEPIALMRATQFIPGKGGRLPKVRMANAHLTAQEGYNLLVEPQTAKPAITGERGRYRMELEGRRVTDTRMRNVVRALAKMALGFVWLDHRDNLAMSERLDETRRLVLGSDRFSGYLLMSRKTGEPTRESSFTYQFVNGKLGQRLRSRPTSSASSSLPTSTCANCLIPSGSRRTRTAYSSSEA